MCNLHVLPKTWTVLCRGRRWVGCWQQGESSGENVTPLVCNGLSHWYFENSKRLRFTDNRFSTTILDWIMYYCCHTFYFTLQTVMLLYPFKLSFYFTPSNCHFTSPLQTVILLYPFKLSCYSCPRPLMQLSPPTRYNCTQWNSQQWKVEKSKAYLL